MAGPSLSTAVSLSLHNSCLKIACLLAPQQRTPHKQGRRKMYAVSKIQTGPQFQNEAQELKYISFTRAFTYKRHLYLDYVNFKYFPAVILYYCPKNLRFNQRLFFLTSVPQPQKCIESPYTLSPSFLLHFLFELYLIYLYSVYMLGGV